MSNILNAFLEFIKEKDLSIYEVSKKIGIPKGRIYQWKNGNGSPKAEDSEKIVQFLTLNGGIIDKKILTLKFNASEKGSPIGEYANKNNRFTELSDGRFEMFTKLVTIKAKAGYLTGWGDEEFIDSLPDHIVTITNTEKGLPKGMYMSFEIDGDSMDYDGRDAIPNRSIVTGRQISRSLWNSKLHLKDYKDYIIVCFEGVLCKRIIDHDVENGTITIHSLNPDKKTFPDEVIDLKQVMQIFNIVKKEITY